MAGTGYLRLKVHYASSYLACTPYSFRQLEPKEAEYPIGMSLEPDSSGCNKGCPKARQSYVV